MVHYHTEGSHWKTLHWNQMHIASNNTHIGCWKTMIYWYQGAKSVQWKHSRHCTLHVLAEIQIHQTRLCFFSQSEPLPTAASDFCHGEFCSLRCFLLITAVKMNYHSLSVSSNQSSHSPLTSLRRFHPQNCWMFFFFGLWQHSEDKNSRDCRMWNSQEINSNTETSCLAPTITQWAKSLRLYNSLFWWLMWTLTEALTCICIISMHCIAATWLDDWINAMIQELVWQK